MKLYYYILILTYNFDFNCLAMIVLIFFLVRWESSELADGLISMPSTLTILSGITCLVSLEKTNRRVGDTLILKEMPVLQIGLL